MSRRDKSCPRMSEDSKIVGTGESVPAEVQRIVSLANSGNLDGATELAKSLRDERLARESWRVIALANANLQRFGAALHAIDLALGFAPDSPQLRLDRGLLLEADGRPDE